MKYKLTNPCSNCPFRYDVPAYLTQGRAEKIIECLLDQQGTFSCHNTNSFDDEDGEAVETKNTQHCAGAMIMLEHMEQPNQMMRIAERLGMYDRSKLNMDAPVFDDANVFIEHHNL